MDLEFTGAPASARRNALTQLSGKKTMTPQNSGNAVPVSEYFGELTFGVKDMRERLPREAYSNLVRALDQGKKLTRETADTIAHSIKDWAVSKGATHFCHWFQPMTGLTAEKHDALISIQHSYHSELRVIERFTGGQLIQGEPDASSFPSGGMRSTFEARGYTAWDPSSPLFLIEGERGRTLCIPCVFIGYHGEALDFKTPLLRSQNSLSREACEFLKLLGDIDVKSVAATLGAEQEYFLIDRKFAALRPDIIMTGRTLLGAGSPRGQQLEDHYFGTIPSRILSFMEELEYELFRLGIPIKTRHNEVAPAQYEIAPIFENANISADHNCLMMEVMKKVANRHGFVCLLHEKPFAGINGSGKHNNWSMANDKGENLLEPGKTPHQNLRFLAILSVVLKAVKDHSDLLRVSIASPGNDHRLGANEAPPAIISVFLGALLGKILDDIESGKAAEATETQIINLGVGMIPDVTKDYTDRNRTSPFAFTGNKFEYRAVGSSANVSFPMTILNAAVADALAKASLRLKDLLSKKTNRDEAVMELIREFAKETKAVRFEGNGYSDEWKAEAKKRGLPIFNSTVDALPVMKDTQATAFLLEQKVYSRAELESRYHVGVERYVKTILIEMNTLIEMVGNQVLPAVENHLVRLAEAHRNLSSTAVKTLHTTRLAHLEATLGGILKGLELLKEATHKAESQGTEEDKMSFLHEKTLPAAALLREACDQAELLVADELWPLPKYREMLFANSIT